MPYKQSTQYIYVYRTEDHNNSFIVVKISCTRLKLQNIAEVAILPIGQVKEFLFHDEVSADRASQKKE